MSLIRMFLHNAINKILGGYGRTLLKPFRGCGLELPLTLGRDFCGTILNKGHGVGNTFNVGDKVYGFVPLHKQGTFSEVVLADKTHVSFEHLFAFDIYVNNRST